MPILKKHLLNETTEVSPAASAAEITKELVSIGALSVETRYDRDRITGLRWSMLVNGAPAWFSMPARVDGVLKILVERQQSQPVNPQRLTQLREKAERIAWRHLYRWTQSQVAMVRTTMLQPAEPFVPFATFRDGSKTLFEVFAEQGRLEAATKQ